VTLTCPVLESSEQVVFLISGEDKRAVFVKFRRGDQALPAARLRPLGPLWLFADRAAVEASP
jgi:6-phosphogluconolactonase